MARVLFVWELGGGLGHTLVNLGLAERLRDAGHQVIFAIRDLAQAEGVIGRAGFHYLQAPVRLRAVTDPVSPAVTYPQILHNIGFSDPEGLLSQVKAWRLLYAIVRPAMVVFDHSPTALLAAAGLAAHKVHVGTGFTVPPPLGPFPRLAAGVEGGDEGEVAVEAGVLASVNRVRETLGLTPLGRVADLLVTDEDVLLTFPELDHYGARPEVHYWGDGPRDAGAVPDWPAGGGRRVLAYLKPFATLEPLLASLSDAGAATLVYGPQLPGALVRRFAGPSMRFSPVPVNLVRAGRECDLAVLNGTHGSTAAMLLAGRPTLQLPLNLEQLITASRVQAMGAGLSAPLLKPRGMAAKLAALMADDGYRGRAEDFAVRHREFAPARRDAAIARRLEARLGGAST